MSKVNEVDAYNVILGNGRYGSTDRPITQMTMGELYDFGRNTLIPNTRDDEQLGLKGTGKGSSAVGAYQIVGDTMQDVGSKLYGQDWRNTQFSPEVQDAMAKVIYDRADKTNLHKVWTSLPQGDYSKSSFDAMRGMIQKGESGGNGYYRSAPTRHQAKANSTNAVSTPVEVSPALQQAQSALIVDNTADIQATYANGKARIADERAALEDQRSALYPSEDEDYVIPTFTVPRVDISKFMTPIGKRSKNKMRFS